MALMEIGSQALPNLCTPYSAALSELRLYEFMTLSRGNVFNR